jgi:hypothetical protein
VAYAEISDVKGRGGRLSPAWSASSTPADFDLQRFIDDVAGEIDAVVQGAGFTAPATGLAASALRGLNADGALLLALQATFPAGEGPAAAQEILRATEERYRASWERLIAGTHPAIIVLETDVGVGVLNASSFWTDEPDYGQEPYEERLEINPWLQPEFERGMKW